MESRMTKSINIKFAVAIFIAGLTASNISIASSANVQISTANTHSCSITPDRVVECWRNIADGKLGAQNLTGFKTRLPMNTSDTPPAITRGVATGNRHSCAIVDESSNPSGYGLVKCWGNNSEGQLGNGFLEAQ